jgi:hypothetical protein
MPALLPSSAYCRERCALNNFENEDALEDFEVEITDLDSDPEKSRASVLWLYGQRLWSQARMLMLLSTLVAVTILLVTLSSSSLLRVSHGSDKAPAIPATPTSQQEFSCATSSGGIFLLASTYNGMKFWNKARGLPDEFEMVAASCILPIDTQIVPGNNGSVFGFGR